MARFEDHLWSEVLRRSAECVSGLLDEEVGPSEVAELCSEFIVEEDVLRFDVSVYDRRLFTVQVVHSQRNLSHVLGSRGLIQPTSPAAVAEKTASLSELQYEVEAVSVFEVVCEFDDVGVTQTVHYAHLSTDEGKSSFAYDSLLRDHFDGVSLAGLTLP